MENQTKTYLTRSELIEKLLALPVEYENAPIVFSYVDGNEESGEKIQSVNIFQVISTNSVSLDENIPIIVITNNPQETEETTCECDECVQERMINEYDADITEEDSIEEAYSIQKIYLETLVNCGIQDWTGYKYFQEEFKVAMIKEGYDESNFAV